MRDIIKTNSVNQADRIKLAFLLLTLFVLKSKTTYILDVN